MGVQWRSMFSLSFTDLCIYCSVIRGRKESQTGNQDMAKDHEVDR